MCILSSGMTATRILIGLALCWFSIPKEVAAQSAPGVLIVAADPSDAECVQRIGGEHVHVKHLFAPETGAMPTNYEACDERIRGLLSFRLIILRADAYCPSESFWRERMAAANPEGAVYRVSHGRCRATTGCDRGIQQASDIHGALASILPEHRASLDANLKAELQRLQSERLRALQLASGE